MIDQHYESINKITELCSAKEDRIRALESEIERLQVETKLMEVDNAELEALSLEELRIKYQELDQKYALLNGELSSMSSAYQKSAKLASQKTSDFAIIEDKMTRTAMDKAKADQKFYAAMKTKETQAGEIKTLRLQNAKSAEAVTALKEAESSSRALLATLEKQVSELKDALSHKTNEHRTVQQTAITTNLELTRLQSSLTDLRTQSTQKDTKLASISSSCRAAEAEVSELQSVLKDTRRQLEAWKSKSGQNEQYEMLRQVAYCNVCKKNLKNTVLKNCGHTFCDGCVKDRLDLRARKCPNCGKGFGLNDHMRITL
jgi:E3 ubiquitin-protein ligase BRE1